MNENFRDKFYGLITLAQWSHTQYGNFCKFRRASPSIIYGSPPPRITCHDLHFEKGLFDSFENEVSKSLVKSNWLQWMGLQKAIPAKLISSTQPKERNTTFKIGDKIYDVTKCRCKTFYSLLIETKAIPSNGFQKVKTDFNLEDDDVKEVFRLSKTAATETFINSFQY